MKTMKRLLLTIQIVAALTSSTFGQAVTRGTVSGRVTNSSGAAVAKALIVVTSDVAPSYKSNVTCNDNGEFSVSEVPGGPVTASVVNANGVVRASAKATLTNNPPTAVVSIQIPAGK